MNDGPTRCDLLRGIAVAPLLESAVQAQARDSAICFLSAVEMARLIRTKKLSAPGVSVRV